jgi:hypothetical protein
VTVWEWRVFAARLEPGELDELDEHLAGAGPAEVRTDVYVTAPGLGPGRGLKLRDGRTLELKVLASGPCTASRAPGLDLWSKVFLEGLEVPSWRTRELSRLLAPGAPVPVHPLRAREDVLRLVRDQRLGEPRARVVDKEVVAAVVEPGVRVERARLRVDGRPLVTVALEGADPDAVRALAARLALPADARLASYPALLAGDA